MPEPGQRGVPEGVDAAAIARQVDAEAFVVAGQGRPESFARRHRARERFVRQRPDAGARHVRGRAAPAISDKFDVVALQPLGGRAAFRPQRLEIRVLGREERQRPVIEHRAHDDRPSNDPVVADAAAGLRDVPLRRAEGQHLLEDFPVAARRLVTAGGTFGQEREAAHQIALAVVQLDGGGETVGRERGSRPDRERAVDRRRGGGQARDVVGEVGQGVDLIERLVEAILEIFALAGRLWRVRRSRSAVPSPPSRGRRATDTWPAPARPGRRKGPRAAPPGSCAASGATPVRTPRHTARRPPARRSTARAESTRRCA